MEGFLVDSFEVQGNTISINSFIKVSANPAEIIDCPFKTFDEEQGDYIYNVPAWHEMQALTADFFGDDQIQVVFMYEDLETAIILLFDLM